MKLFYISCSGSIWTRTAKILYDDYDAKPVLWSASASTLTEIKSCFPDCMRVEDSKAAYTTCLEDDEDSGTFLQSIPTSLLQALAVDETIAMAMMDRFDTGSRSLSYETKRRLWHGLVRLWYARLCFHQPNCVIFPTAPHIVYDWVIYVLCKQLGIKTRLFERTALPGKMLLLERFEEGSTSFRHCLSDINQEVCLQAHSRLTEEDRQHLAGLRQTDAISLPPNYEKKLKKQGILNKQGRQKQSGLVQHLLWEVQRAAYLLLKRQQAPDNYMLYEQQDGSLLPATTLQWLWARWSGQVQKRRMRRLLSQLGSEIIPEEPFILYALHFQPERAVVPMAGILSDQLLIIDMLARSLPKGWKLVVKEHPWQLVEFSRGECGRTRHFYQQIASYSNVVLCDASMPTTDFLKKSQAIATVTGSLGWQAIACQKPALVFGAAWYRDCPGVFAISDSDECQTALAAIEEGYHVPKQAAEHSLLALKGCLVVGYLEERLEAVSDIDEGEASQAMAHALAAPHS